MGLAEDLAGVGATIRSFLEVPLVGQISLFDVVLALATLVVGVLVVRVVARTLRRALRRAGIPPLVRRFLLRISRFLLYVAVIGLALTPLGVNLTSLVIAFGVVGIVVGMALQDSLSNLVSGLLLLVLRPFRQGNLVEAAGVTGFVEDLGLNATILKTFDGKRVTIPSKLVWGAPITNFHAWPIRRIDLVVSLDYRDDASRALEVVQRVLDTDDRILREPAPTANVKGIQEGSVELNVFAWANQEDWGTVRTDLQLRVKEGLEEAGFTIPYPSQTIRLEEGETG